MMMLSEDSDALIETKFSQIGFIAVATRTPDVSAIKQRVDRLSRWKERRTVTAGRWRTVLRAVAEAES